MKFDRIALLVLLLAATVTGAVLISAFDRMRAESRKAVSRLNAIEDLLRSGAFAAPGGRSGASGGDFPNREFYLSGRDFEGRLVTTYSADPPNLNYLITSEALVGEINELCHASLGKRNYADPVAFQPWLAESWSISDDHLTYRIKLRRGVLWHDAVDPETGETFRNVELTSRDFLFMYEVLNNPEVNCAPLRVYYQALKELRIIDDYTFEVEWAEPYFRSLELTMGLKPLPRHFYWNYPGDFNAEKFNYDHLRNDALVGVGPYRLEEWKRNQRIRLKRFDGYFGRDHGALPGLDEIVYEMVKLDNPRFLGLISGKYDQIGLIPEQWVNRTDTPQFAVTLNADRPAFDASAHPELAPNALLRIQSPGASYNYIAYNREMPIFADRRVRQAMTLLVNRERILRDVYFGLGEVISGPFRAGSPYNDRECRPWPFDPARARELLAEAGWRDTDGDGILDKNGRKFAFTMMQVADHPLQSKYLPIIKEDMAAAGIDMRIDIYEWSIFLTRINERNFEACSLGWTQPFEADPYQIWHSSQADLPQSSNFIGFRDPEADRLIEAIRRTFDAEERIELCHRFQRLLHEDQPYTFLMSAAALTGMAAKYDGVRLFPLEQYPVEIMWRP